MRPSPSLTARAPQRLLRGLWRRIAHVPVVFLLLPIVVLVLIVVFSRREPWPASSEEEPKRFKIHMSGEDKPFERGQKADIVLVSGGANLDPERSFWFPELLAAWNNIFEPDRKRYLPISKRRGPDVLYRSSLCNKEREDAVAMVRRAVEQAGFTFVAEGLCQGTGYPYNDRWNEVRDWTDCPACRTSKVILAFERFSPNITYLGEKLFFPMEYGAIAAYRGNGHPWMDLLTVNRRCYLDKDDFDSDEAFAQGIVDLLRDPRRMQQMQDEEVFLDLDNAKARVDFWKDPFKVGWRGSPELHAYLQRNVRYQELKSKPVIKYTTTRLFHPTVDAFVRFLFRGSDVQRTYDLEEADIEVYRCC